MVDDFSSQGSGSWVELEALADPSESITDAVLLRKVFAELPERWRAVLWLSEVEGRSRAEIAEQLGLTVAGVSSLALRARAGLRRAMAVTEGGSRGRPG